MTKIYPPHPVTMTMMTMMTRGNNHHDHRDDQNGSVVYQGLRPILTMMTIAKWFIQGDEKVEKRCCPHENGDLNTLIYKGSRLRGNSNRWLNNDFFITLLSATGKLTRPGYTGPVCDYNPNTFVALTPASRRA